MPASCSHTVLICKTLPKTKKKYSPILYHTQIASGLLHQFQLFCIYHAASTPRGSSLCSFRETNVGNAQVSIAIFSIICSRPVATWRNILVVYGVWGEGWEFLGCGAQPAWLMANKPQYKLAKLLELGLRLRLHSICTKLSRVARAAEAAFMLHFA